MPVQANPSESATRIINTAYYSGPNGSGMEPVSGINASGDASGPWFIEEQTLNFVYSRVPNVAYNPASGLSLDLDSAAASYDVANTCLVLKGRAKYSVKKSYKFFDSSGYQQGQKFEVVATSSDYLGQSYGTPSAGTFGPAGEINTTQKYYNRRHWDASTDAEIHDSVRFLSVYETDADTGVPDGSVGNKFGKYDYWFENEEITCGIQGIAATVKGFTDINVKWGPYIATQDSTSDVSKIIDLVGDLITEQQFFAQKAKTTYTPDGGDTGSAYYSSERHTYL
jgi:hypothetical protein